MLLTSDLIKLKNIQLYLEKPDNLHHFLIKYGLFDYYSDVENQRKIDVEKDNKDVIELAKLLVAKRELLRNGVDNLDLKSFKKDMITTQEIIYNLKSDLKRKMEKLELDEREIADQVKTFKEKISDWEKPVPLCSKNNNNRRFSAITFEAKEVTDFMDFLKKNHGHEGGWASDDHLLFLKFRTKFKSDIEKVAFNVHRLLPDITEDSVREHEEWYKQYLLLRQRKKEALDTWRKIKKEACEAPEQTPGAQEIAKRKNPPKEDVRQKLALWKNEKLERKQREEECMSMIKQRLKELQASKLKMREEVKLSVEKWKQAKLEKDQEIKMKKEQIETKEKQLKIAEANKMLKMFRSQDDLYVARMQQIKKPKEKVEIKRSKSSQIRDPKRVFQPTKQWLSRTTDNSSEHISKPVISNIKCVPKLGVPEWRRHQGTRF